jgi:hypothetical protein
VIEDVWRLLGTVSTFDLLVRHHRTNELLHRASGLIRVDALVHTITWHEQGEWVTGPLTGIHFTNATLWEQAGSAAIRVSHRRWGPEPVFLSTLRATGAGEWAGEPHLCGADRYVPVLSPAVDHLVLTWNVASPTDPYRWEMRAR